jgi:predicted amidohydrolase YtcJ
MLIRNAEVNFGERVDLRIERHQVVEMAPSLPEQQDEEVIDAQGCALLPGLHDHHLHLRSLAAALSSVACGPPRTQDAAALTQALQAAAQDCADAPGEWIRGVGYHESVAGELDRHWLDRVVPEQAVRIQHRSGRLWILSSRALALLGASDGAANDPLERIDGQLTGRLYDADPWLRSRLGNSRQALQHASRKLASHGVTGLTETTPSNGPDELRYFRQARARGEILQDMLVMGDSRLDDVDPRPINGVARGPRKFHLHDAALPELGEVCAAIEASHRYRRAVAFHCVTRAELVFTLVALREAGSMAGDRIEHASITPPDLLAQMAEMGLTVVTQPNFIAERGDAYLRDVADEDQAWLYRLRGFLDAGIALAGSTDAPFGDCNPWIAMQAAVSRCTHDGVAIGAGEAISPEEALGLFQSPLATPGQGHRRVMPGVVADLCLLDRSWAEARKNLAEVWVQLTLKDGSPIWPLAEPGATEDRE